MPPGRSKIACSPLNASTVDSMPTVQAPPSRMKSTRSPKLSRTCSAVVGESWVKRLALGAATGTCAASISASATGCEGMRSPTVGRPAVTRSGTAGCLRNTRVSGPGQKRWASSSARCGHSAHDVPRHLAAADVHDDGTALADGPWPRRCERQRQRPGHSRPAHRRFRWETRPVCRRAASRRRAEFRRGLAGELRSWRATSRGISRSGGVQVHENLGPRSLPEGNSYCRPRRSGGRRRSSPAVAVIAQTARLRQSFTPLDAGRGGGAVNTQPGAGPHLSLLMKKWMSRPCA